MWRVCLKRLEAAGLRLHFYKVARKAFSEEWSEQYALTTIASDDNFVYFVTVSDTDEYDFPAKENLTVEYSKKLNAGFKISPKEGGYLLQFTDEEFTRLISSYLRPAAKKLLFG